MTPTLIGNLFAIALLLPLVAGVVSLLTRKYEWNNTLVQLTLALSGFAGLIGVGSFYIGLAQGSLTEVAINVLGVFQLGVGPLSAFFLMLIYAGVLLTSIYSIESLPHYRKAYALPWLNVASALFIFGMQACVASQSIFAFLLFWEVMSVAAYFLVIADRSEESLEAGWLYFVMTHIGFAFLVSGFLLLSQGDVLASWADTVTVAAGLSWPVQTAAFLLLLAGFGSKAGLVPLHQWLPYAHPQAPSGSSALLSGVMLKVALFGFIQSLALFVSVPFSWGLTIVGVGLLSAFFGALHAAVESDMKRLLAWSSIENMGLIFSGVGMYLIVLSAPQYAVPGMTAGLVLFIAMHTLNHFLFKTGLFMAAGAVASATHTRELDGLGGLAQRWPLFSGVFLVLSLAAAALPPFGTFFGEWAYLQSLAIGMGSSSVVAALGFALALALVALVSGLAIFAYVKMFSAIFLGRARSAHAEDVSPMPRLLTWPPLVCAVLALLASLVALPILAAPARAFEFARWVGDVTLAPGASIHAWLLLLVVLFIGVLILFVRRTSTSMAPARMTDTWDCGQPLTPRMQYTATGFSAPIRFFFRSILLSRKTLEVEAVSSKNPWIARRRLHWSVSSFWEHWMYRPVGALIVSVSHFTKRIQSGVIQLYLLLILCTLIGVLFTAL